MKNIFIDARLYGPKHTGIGRYTQNLLIALDKLIPLHENLKFTAVVYPDILPTAKKDLKNISLVACHIPHYSLQEQLNFSQFISSFKPDLVHFTHFNKPLLYLGKSVVTIHDLIKHYFKGKETTTRTPLFYWPKYLAYRILVHIVLKTSQIIVPSNFWRNLILRNYHLDPDNIITTYEAVDPKFLASSSKTQNTKIEIDNYILYTGNLYPHKNFKILLQALKELPDVRLKVISARDDVFRRRIEKEIIHHGLSSKVELLGYVPDNEFFQLYSQAIALVHPSYMEGFSLTGLEAMALNCPVVSSTSSCLPEIYKDSVLYFDPDNPKELVSQIKKLLTDSNLRKQLIKKGQNLVQQYSWDKTAQETLGFYLKNLKNS